ncbi:ATP F0F1 synthase subunit B' [Salipiger aestuarii]|uniref:ATP synthase subunit b n=1 Tax=Salipiger aestuarii TaxID=568098 RepID=A0A327YM70_9RHOB|nr:F0F1 ATP synthase subunit B' [Salipiger aestuarii]EIE50187.1 F0F1 ATP synthase subunit B' [Citreicella sp. 357]KAA8609965.1 ATP F0F1 synthase subunit B' [Salipiger aestuarii]KAB2543225.1 ATP F0F1 synthase subunit B' [Salipiger aestuarii]RAK21552.1 F-type H+-transporting ATPase subunit b [Salipiger aestuarii]
MATTQLAEDLPGICVDDHGSAIGMPQLCADWVPNQIFWLVITLVVIFFILSRIALPRIASVVAERTGTITNDIAAAEELKRQAGEAEKDYDRALADARAQAQAIGQQTRDDIKAQLDTAVADADAKIAAKTAESEAAIDEIRASSVANIEIVAKDTALAIVAALGATADQETVSRAVDSRMKG